MSGDCKPEQLPSTMADDEEPKQALECQGRASAWLRRKVPQGLCDGGPRRRIMYLLTIFGNDTRRSAESAFALPEIHFAWRGR
jgi:hypothetical protein